MIDRKFEDIDESDIRRLLDDGISENQTLEYKRDLPGTNDEQKREFLADISAFANTSGGDLVYGVEDSEGIASNIIGVISPDLDLEIRRLDSFLRDGLEPRLSYQIRRIALGTTNNVILIRVDKSWSGPHRVIFRGHDKFTRATL